MRFGGFILSFSTKPLTANYLHPRTSGFVLLVILYCNYRKWFKTNELINPDTIICTTTILFYPSLILVLNHSQVSPQIDPTT